MTEIPTMSRGVSIACVLPKILKMLSAKTLQYIKQD